MKGQLNSRILLVDDEPIIRKAITGYLVAEGYVVRAAVDGLDALQKLRGGVPDLVISDLNMPRMSGFELVAVLRQRLPQVPVVIITAGTITEGMAEEVGADAYFQKNGHGLDGLLKTVAELTGRAQRQISAPIPERKTARARWDGDGHYIIDCEECLRSFSVPRGRFMGRHEQWTTCLHCRNSVQFLTEDTDLPVSTLA